MSRRAVWTGIVLVAVLSGARAGAAEASDGDAASAAQGAIAETPSAPEVLVAPDLPGPHGPPVAPEVLRTPGASSKPETTWYGWQTLLADGSAVGLWALGFAVDDAKSGSGSPQSYQLGANGVVIGSVACSNSNDVEFIGCPVVAGALGFLAGAASAPVVDAAFLAREPVTAPPGPPLQAAFVPSNGGGQFLLAGRF